MPTGVPGLDAITGGGFLRSGVYILQGTPGAGKTILANQVAYNTARRGGNVVYVTMLAESHSRLLQHLGEFSFFDPGCLPDRVYYVSAFNALRSHGLVGVIDLLRNEMRTRSAELVVLDGLVIAAAAARSDEELKVFINDIQTHSVLAGCTTLLLASDDPDRHVSAEQTMVDGIFLLRESAYGPRRERNIEVVKFRGSATLRGNHVFVIGDDGVVIHPRLEAALRAGPDGCVMAEGVSTGIQGLDQMFAIGGFAKGSINVICGQSGSGKTSIALHFLAQATRGEPSLFVGFYESPEFLQAIAREEGIPRADTLAQPHVSYQWRPFGENILDVLSTDLLEAVRRLRPARVVIDGVGGFVATASFKGRGGAFLATLMNELRHSGATTLVTVETGQPGDMHMDTATLSALADTVVNCRVDTDPPRVRRFVWIGKSRVTRSDLRIRELVLGQRGLEVKDEAQS